MSSGHTLPGRAAWALALGLLGSACQAWLDVDQYSIALADSGPVSSGPAGSGGDGSEAVAFIGTPEAGVTIANGGGPLNAGGSDAVGPSAATCGAASSFEPNNTPSTACPLAFGPSQSTEQAIGLVTVNTDPDDYYSVDGVLSRHTYTLELSVTGACPVNGISSEVSLQGAEGSSSLLSRSLQSAGKLAREFTPNVNGRAIIRVGGSCAYELIVHRSTDDGLEHDAVFEPNNSPSTAARLTLGQTESSQVTPGIDPDDYYAVDVESGRSYAVTLTATGPCPANGLSTEASLAAPEGTSALLARSLHGPTMVLRSFTPNLNGRAILRVGGQCAYALAVSTGM